MLNAASVERAWTTDDTMNLPGRKTTKKKDDFLGYYIHISWPLKAMKVNYSFCIFTFSSSFTAYEADFLTRLCGDWLVSVQSSGLGLMVPVSPVFFFFSLPVICDLHSVFWGKSVRKLCSSQITELDPQRVHEGDDDVPWPDFLYSLCTSCLPLLCSLRPLPNPRWTGSTSFVSEADIWWQNWPKRLERRCLLYHWRGNEVTLLLSALKSAAWRCAWSIFLPVT